MDKKKQSGPMIPLNESEFKPRLNRKICQYCGYTKNTTSEVDEHVQNQHEFNIWYKCNKCKFVCFNRPKIRRHYDTVHKLKLVKDDVKNLVINDSKRIQELRQGVIKERKLQEKLKTSKTLKKHKKNSIFIPIEKSDFKARIDPNICQYCGYENEIEERVDQHVNIHELTSWYKCRDCELVSTCVVSMKYHIRTHHDYSYPHKSIKTLIIKDKAEINHLRSEKIQKKKAQEEFSKFPPNQLAKEPKFIPINRKDFKPCINPWICQYCGHSSKKDKRHVEEHVNSMHEMTTWYQCQRCEHASPFKEIIVSHSRLIHNVRITVQDAKLCLVTDQVEIDRLKQKRIEEKQAKEEFSKMSPDRLNKKSKYIPIDRKDFKPRINPRICQYCGYTCRNTQTVVSKHVNANHEMTTWYKCQVCSFATLHVVILKMHLMKKHLHKDVTPEEINKCIITDTEEIDRLRAELIKKKHINEEFSKLPPTKINKTPKFIPMEKANFKPRIYPRVCQYCGMQGRSSCDIDIHVNVMHEMTDWYKCPECKFTNLTTREIRNHLTKIHSKHHLKEENLRGCIIRDPKTIDQLKRKRIQQKKKKKTEEEESKLVTGIYPDFKPRTNPSICQYCGHKGKDKTTIDVHVNVNHEMTHWYKCEHCNLTTLGRGSLRNHLELKHSEKDNRQETLRRFLVKDHMEIDRLRKERIEQKHSHDEFVKVKQDLFEKVKRMIPSYIFEFKPRIHPKVCQYCGLKSKHIYVINEHVNRNHEMVYWYQCNQCSTSTTNIRVHINQRHKKLTSKEEISKMMILDPVKVCHLKKTKMQNAKIQERRTSRKRLLSESSFSSTSDEDEDAAKVVKVLFVKRVKIDENDCHSVKIKMLSINLERLKPSVIQELSGTRHYNFRNKKKVGHIQGIEVSEDGSEELMIKDEVDVEEHWISDDEDQDKTWSLADLNEEWLDGPSW